MDTSKVKHFVFYRSYADALSCISEEDQLKVFHAMMGFAFDGALPDFDLRNDHDCFLCWTLIQPSIQKSMENQMNGSKGGRPPKEPSQ